MPVQRGYKRLQSMFAAELKWFSLEQPTLYKTSGLASPTPLQERIFGRKATESNGDEILKKY
jgi:CRISPR/Cas system endoribonuclease Cas6 (RAMP superfamily)